MTRAKDSVFAPAAAASRWSSSSEIARGKVAGDAEFQKLLDAAAYAKHCQSEKH